jgi:hypothetical protein
MKKIKVSIKDESTLILLEDAASGDIIDLTTLHDVDIDTSTIKNVVQSIKKDKLDAEVKKQTQAIENEFNHKLSLRERDLADKAKEEINKKTTTINQLHLELKNISEKAERDAENTILKEREKIKEQYDRELKEKESELSKIKHEKEFSEEKLKGELKASQNELVHQKEMKVKMSTKMVGESLELHCENEFNRIRFIAFPNAQF